MENPEKINILLVDDTPDKLFALANELNALGQNVVQARSGEEALRLLLKQDFALILLDVRMPGMDGFETAHLIRQRRNSEYTPIIFITGIDRTESDVSKGYSLGAVDYLFTPVVREVMLAKVAVFIELYRKTQEIKRSQKLLAEAQQIAQLGSWKWDRKTDQMDCSDECSRILGLHPGTAITRDMFLDRVHPNDRSRVSEIFARSRLNNVACDEIDFCVVRPNRDVRSVYARTETVNCNQPDQLVGTLLDITERKRAEEDLRDSERKYRSVTETALSAIITAQEDGTIIYANQSAERIFGWPLVQLIGLRFESLFPDQYRSFVDFQHLGSTETAQLLGKTLILSGCKKSGIQFPIELSLASWTSHQDARYTAIVSDITERVAAERKLAAEVQERKAAEEKILEISGREQRRIGEELHDGLGQALTGISFLTKVLAKKLAQHNPVEAAEAERIVVLIGDALRKTRDMARGFYPVELESNGLVFALRELAAREKNIFGITCSFETSETSAVNDLNRATQVYRIAQEAIENAIKHGLAKTVSIKLEKFEDKFVLTVEDDGSGFPAKLPAKRGMGLQIMKYRAGIIQGTFEIQRKGRRGTRVTCQFPQTINDTHHENQHASSSIQKN